MQPSAVASLPQWLVTEPMPLEPSVRRRIAYHESAHGAVGLRLNIPFAYLEIAEDSVAGTTTGRMLAGPPRPATFG
jgi:hypothetical protein